MSFPRVALPFAVLSLAAVSLSCDSPSRSVAGLEDSDFLAKPARCEDDPNGPGCGGGEVEAGSEVTFAGAMSTEGPQGVTAQRDNKKSFVINNEIVTVDVHFSNTVGTDAAVGSNCVIRAQDGSVVPDDIEQALISALRATGSLRRRLDLQVNKQDMTGGIRLTAPEDGTEPDEQLWTSLGFNTGALAQVWDMNSNLAQSPADRTEPLALEYSGGNVRAVYPIGVNVLADIVCSNKDVVTLTITEVAS